MRTIRWCRLLAVLNLLAAVVAFWAVVWDTPARNGLVFLSTAVILFLIDRPDDEDAA